MVSSGTVSSDANALSQSSTNYMSQIESLSSVWTGSSHDSITNKCAEFHSQMQQVINQLTSFAEAVGLYEQYKEIKNQHANYVSAYNQLTSSDNESAINQYRNAISECEAKMNDLSSKIKAALSAASSFKMDSSNNTGQEIETTLSDESTKETVHQGGDFIADSRRGVYGHMTTSINGKTHTVYRQSQIPGWSGDCNRAAASSIASAFTHYDGEAVDIAKKSQDGIGYNSDVTNKYFANFGLTANVNKVNSSYDSIKNEIISNLSQGNYVMFDLSEPNVVGQSGQRWSYRRHWLSVLDIKRTGDGPNDYAIFVSDSGHGGSTVDHGLGTGWYSINEFNGEPIANFTTVTSTPTAA